MKILFISAYLPGRGLHGGSSRIFELLHYLHRHHEITLLCFKNRLDDDSRLKDLRSMCKKISVFLTREKLPFYPFPFEPFMAYVQDDFRKKLQKLVQREKFDLVQYEYVQMGIYHKDLAHIPSVLTEHEVNFLALQRSLPFIKGPLKKLKDYYDSLQMMKRELDVLNRMDRVICMNRHDANALVGYVPQEKLEILPHGVDTAYFAPMADVTPEPNAIGYFGAFQHYPNVDAVLYFVHDIFPLIKERIPDAHFYVIGSNPPEEIKQLHGRTDITVTGFVPDIRPYMARCAVIVAPIRLGLGMRVKVVEAMAMGKPVVATELACEGIDVTDGADAAMANTEESFAESVCYMLQDHACASAMGAAARKLVERNFEYRAIGERLDRIYRSVTNR